MKTRRLVAASLLLAACGVGAAPSATDAATTTDATSETIEATSTEPVPATAGPDTSETTTTTPPLQALRYQEIAGGLDVPVLVVAHPGAAIAFLVTKDGRVWQLENDTLSESPVLDISARVKNSGEQGLLGMALHPSDESRVFLHYTGVNGDTVLSEFAMVAGVIDPRSERELLRIDQPASNHNGGMIQFGPNGRLYLGLGDGGAANDAFGNGQNPGTLLAGLVAVDVDTGAAIKQMSGLRNPWRFWIDGDIVVIGDVGQDKYEEVSVAGLDERANFGWPITEGLHCFGGAQACDKTGITMPVLEVRHGDGGACSITGGVVYRGNLIPELTGRYLFSDYCGGWLRSFDLDDPTDVVDHTDEVGVPGSVVSFGVDGMGEVYVLTTDGAFRLVADR